MGKRRKRRVEQDEVVRLFSARLRAVRRQPRPWGIISRVPIDPEAHPMTVTAHYDGRVFVPDEPVDLPVGTAVRLTVVPAAPPPASQLMRAELYARIQEIIARSYKPGPPENTSENVDAILYGRPGDPGDVR
ncbi:MAG TPA: hypothetical protein VFG68_23645 [Fimbriiglobus sp.]|nr:hypothetical protein [Fimbriiglobus sp.]